MNEKERRITVLLGVLIILASVWLFCGKGLHDNGNGAQQVGIQLEQAGNNQHKFTERVGNIEEKLNSYSERVERIESGERKAGAIIAECQSILRTVRQRGAQDESTP